jgi:hypothetical protein
MKLKDKTTVKTLREMIGKKIRTRTSRAVIEITDIELNKDEMWFIGYEGDRKRRIPIGRVHELIEASEEEVKESKKSFKSPIREAEEKRLKKWSGLEWDQPMDAILRPLPPGNPDLLS